MIAFQSGNERDARSQIFPLVDALWIKLGGMQTAVPGAQPSSTQTEFAGILAAATDPQWNDDGLAEDVATISYEPALGRDAPSQSRTSQKETDPAPPRGEDGRRLKTASITIRLSGPECAKVRERAAEAGLTVSAYLRSCALEVESLRSQVKETLAQLRTSPEPVHPIVPVEPAHRTTILDRAVRWLRERIGKRHFMRELNPSNPFAPVRS